MMLQYLKNFRRENVKNRIDFLSSTYTPMKIIPNDFNNDKILQSKDYGVAIVSRAGIA